MEDWKVINPDASEARWRKKLETTREPVTVQVYVVANYAGKLSNRMSNSGFLIYVNNKLMKFYINRQNKVEPSSSGLDFMALRISTGMVEALRYNIMIFGVNLEDPAEVYRDKTSVTTNSSVPDSAFKNLYNAI